MEKEQKNEIECFERLSEHSAERKQLDVRELLEVHGGMDSNLDSQWCIVGQCHTQAKSCYTKA